MILSNRAKLTNEMSAGLGQVDMRLLRQKWAVYRSQLGSLVLFGPENLRDVTQGRDYSRGGVPVVSWLSIGKSDYLGVPIEVRITASTYEDHN